MSVLISKGTSMGCPAGNCNGRLTESSNNSSFFGFFSNFGPAPFWPLARALPWGEEIETLNLLCLPVLSVFLHVCQLLGHEEAPPELEQISREYVRLTELTKL